MRKILFGVVVTLVILFTFKYCSEQKNNKIELQESSMLIQEQIQNVGKLIVTEGHFSEVFTYKHSKELLGNFLTSDKKALVVVNADVTIAYDLSKVEFKIDESTKTLTIVSIPKEEIKVSPDLEYYDIQADYLNPFEANDYNNIKKKVKASLLKKLEASDLKANAKNRLISELSKFYILTNSMGWKLQFNNTTISKTDEFQKIKL
ncbi:DUF4230 domain-containing protein [Siansivirga zeaxanthinifaciens]|uniref:DUF4230 domain-containing protein n=1 Tax=Siansivirga zeaxanthinifaciens CC-SAMT-1 TaxID=1454006 RepID=A0A0C5VT06_9FLAO|nr:DUF4230 domain-containing protein [Siansivirga zeaxanthinifaciens]AJR02336.1 hypothetical protein AW14_00435 [Siansivirga zeaxanthinifaciens CC-SAMT-1]